MYIEFLTHVLHGRCMFYEGFNVTLMKILSSNNNTDCDNDSNDQSISESEMSMYYDTQILD